MLNESDIFIMHDAEFFSTADEKTAFANPQLKAALAAAANCEQFIAPEQERVYKLLAEAKTETEHNARLFQLEYIHNYLTRAARLARARIGYFSQIVTEDDIKQELELCAADKIHWFEMYAWGYDPRARTSLSIVPFSLFPKQRELVDWLDDIVFNRRTSGIIEKSRDEGATETIGRWGIHNWRFRQGFSMLLSTRTEDEVDTKKKQGTLFERARFQIKLLPKWMLPDNFDTNRDLLPDKLIANPENGNALVGQAPVENMGRGDRVTCAVFDEFAFWRFGGYPQFRSMSQTTDSIIMPSSVAGRLNQYADIAFDNTTAKFVMDWRDNPFKDKRWYDSLPFGYISPKMSRTTIAQEVDRNYEAAQPGKVWKLKEELVFITYSEFMRPFEKARLSHKFVDQSGRFKIPDDWRTTQHSDYGQSEGHDWGYSLVAQPRAAYPCADTHFVFVSRILEPTGLTTEQAVKQWREYQQQLGLRDVKNVLLHKFHGSYNSHEQLELRKVLLATYGENWSPWQTDYTTGIETLQDWWTPIDLEKPNPFRPGLYGRCRFVFVAPDNEYELAYNERLSQWFVTMSQTDAGFMLARKQISAYHYSESELGKPVGKMRPVKEFDDIVDCLIAGTLVLTKRGDVPIETITLDDYVWTRQGWKRVLAAGLSYRRAETFTLTTNSGLSITATGNHRILTDSGWVSLRELAVCDKIYEWQNNKQSAQKPLSLMALNFTATLTPDNPHTEDILNRKYQTGKKGFLICMSKFGKRITDTFQKTITSTIETATVITTTLLIWNACQVKSIISSTAKTGLLEANQPSIWHTLLISDLLRKSGINHRPGASGIVFMGKSGGITPQSEQAFVYTAKTNSLPKRIIKYIAPLFVKLGIAWTSHLSQSQKYANSANSHLQWQETTATQRPNGFAQKGVIASICGNTEKSDVYNLTVAECPEYYANGILVHNCLRSHGVMWNKEPLPLNEEEKIVEKMGIAVRPDTIRDIAEPERKLQAINASRMVRAEIVAAQKKIITRNPLLRLRGEINKGDS